MASGPVPAPDLRQYSDDEVWERLHGGEVDSPLHRQCVLTLQLRNLQRQTEASQTLVAMTQALVEATTYLTWATRGLVTATWTLVGVSGLLLLVAAVQTVLTFFRR